MESTELITVFNLNEFILRASIDIITMIILVGIIYYPKYKNKDFIFTFSIFNVINFLICILLGSAKIKVGFAFGLFAIFSIIRYRTILISIKDMGYFFVCVALGMLNSLAVVDENPLVLISCNLFVLLMIFLLEKLDFLDNENFYFVRFGAGHSLNNKVFLAAGYAHMWLAPTKSEWNTFSNENRCYQQAQWSSKIGNMSILQRIRNEQRWQQKIVNDQKTGENRFTNRVRYLLSLNIPIFKKSTMPTLVISDEILFHFGKEVVYNTFDQNRIFIGIKQSINPKLSFDFGYMNLYQQKYSGNQYDSNHTLRLFALICACLFCRGLLGRLFVGIVSP